MSEHLRHVVRAAAIFNCDSGTAQERLVQGGNELWQALLAHAHWSEDLWKRTRAVCEVLFAQGSVEATVGRLAPHEANEMLSRLASDVAALAADLECAMSQQTLEPVGGGLNPSTGMTP
jgi:hypothetical protein